MCVCDHVCVCDRVCVRSVYARLPALHGEGATTPTTPLGPSTAGEGAYASSYTGDNDGGMGLPLPGDNTCNGDGVGGSASGGDGVGGSASGGDGMGVGVGPGTVAMVATIVHAWGCREGGRSVEKGGGCRDNVEMHAHKKKQRGCRDAHK